MERHSVRQNRPVDFSSETLTPFARGVLVGLGLGAPEAELVATSLVESDLRGHSSHGVRRLVPYAAQVKEGTLVPSARPALRDGTPAAVAIVDGNDGFGQLTARAGVDALVERLPRTAVGVAVLRRCQHVGRLGEYVEALAARGLVGIAFANADPCVAPWGGRERMLGTNPTAWAVPTADGQAPLVVDFATSATAEGKLSVSRDRGEQVPEGLLVDRTGRDSTDPEDFYAGGALLPFGGHKGYGLSVAFDLVAGLLSGVGSASDPAYAGGFGTVFMALDVAAFVDPETFVADVEAFRTRIRGAARRDPDAPVLVPGEPEWEARSVALRAGVSLAADTVAELDRLAASLDVPPLERQTVQPQEDT